MKATGRRTPLLLTLSFLVMVWMVGTVAADERLNRKVENSRVVFEELLATPERKVPAHLLKESKCIAVIPQVIKGALVWGGRHGRGVMSCRDGAGNWSPPAFVKVSGGSFGFQIGAEAIDLVLFFLTERGVKSLLQSKLTLGGDVGVAAGPLGRRGEVGTDLKFKAEIVSYAKARGLFAGISLEGARLAPDQKAIQRYYGERLWPEDILFDHKVPRLPTGAREFIRSLP